MATTEEVKVGQWGGAGGSKDYDFKPDGKIIKIYVRSGEAIDAIKFGYLISGSTQVHESPWYGGNGGSEQGEFINKAGEEMIELSGTIGGQWGNTVITSLTFKTTKESYHFGTRRGDEFSLPVKAGKFVGFFGKYGDLLDSIGAILVHK